MRYSPWWLAFLALSGCGVSQAQHEQLVQECDQHKQKVSELERKLTGASLESDKLRTDLGMAQSQVPTEQQREELAEAKRAIAEAESRSKTQADLVAKLQKMIDAGQLKVSVRRGQLVLALNNDVLFETGEAEVKPEGKKAIQEIAQALKGLSGRRFQVAGHTDVAPIVSKKKETFPTNWELSSARAIAVVKLLTTHGVRPEVLSAAGHGPYDPVASNAKPEGQAKNRRTEIMLQPDMGEILATAGVDKPGDKKNP